jgi:hypothetical protein
MGHLRFVVVAAAAACLCLGSAPARVFYRRSGSRKLRHKTGSRKFKMCRLAR